MPIWLRQFTFNTIREHFEKEKEAVEKSSNKLTNSSVTASPTYVAKARK